MEARTVPVNEMPEMATVDKVGNTIAVILPFVATVAAIVLFWNRIVTPADLLILLVMYVFTGLGVTVGFHRLLTHRAFQTSKPLRYFFAVLGSLSVQGPVITWVADHRKHHAFTDEEGDPHSPHVGHGDGARESWPDCGTPTSAGRCASTAGPTEERYSPTWSRTPA